MRRLKNLIIHPFLIAAYPILALLAHNIESVEALDALRSLLFSLLSAALLFLILYSLLKDGHKAALIASLTILLFFSYGHVYEELGLLHSPLLLLGRHRFLVPVFLFIWLLLTGLMLRYRGALRPVSQAVTLIAVLAILFPLFSLGRFLASTYASSTPEINPQLGGAGRGASLPDIYYIILDGYSRHDTLEESLHFDNSPFLQALSDLGFYVARCSQSNYSQTQLSLASSMNMNYLQALDPDYADPEHLSRVGLPSLIQKGAVRQYLEKLGYQTVAFDSGSPWTNITDADIFLSLHGGSGAYTRFFGGINEFEVLLLKTSAGLLIADASVQLPKLFKPRLDAPNLVRRERILYTLDELPKVPQLPGAKFVFVHLISPHLPYIFGPDGEYVEGDVERKEGYRNQVIYINKRILPILQQIIASSSTPPVIILQADHGGTGSGPADRMRILNAYYLPGGGEGKLYPTITPVNTFRLILDEYFAAGFPLLDDVSYYSSYERPFDFSLIPNEPQSCAP